MMVLKEWWRILFKPSSDSHRIARRALLNNVSYLYPENDRGNPILGVVELKSIWTRRSDAPAIQINQNDQLVFDRSLAYSKLRSEYLAAQEVKIDGFISKSELLGYKRMLSPTTKVLLYAIAAMVAFRILFSPKASVNLALLIRALFETHILVKLLPVNFSGSLHDFVQYDTDSNAMYLVLKDAINGSYTHFKYPSPGPLMAHNRLMLTDVLCLNHPYHMEEVKAFGGDVIASRVMRVPPERFYEYFEHYTNEAHESGRSIGYYSHGGWVRNAEGHAEDGLNIAQTEIRLLRLLADFLKQNPNQSLTIFLHPREKASQFQKQTVEHYGRIFPSGLDVIFAEKPAAECFQTVKIGLGVYSTILFERLVCGFPTLIMSPISDFPIQGSSLEPLLITEDNLDEKISELLDLSRLEILKKHQLEGYVDEHLPIASKLEQNTNNKKT
ncbi:MAG: hypothetical protein Salg2KO_13030 [Salibacteraceae bacterium]